MRPRLGLLIGCCAALNACERGMHEMYDQPKYLPLTPSSLFADGNSSRPQVTGTVAHSAGFAAGSSSGRNGEQAVPLAQLPVLGADGRAPLGNSAGSSAAQNPPPVTAALLVRGRDRFDIYCAPCHSPVGDGDGMVVRRGFPAPASFHAARLRQAPDSYYFDVMTRGYGVMYPYADRITPEDRWAITAYIRALQLSQHAPVSVLSADERQRLQGRGR